MEAETITESVVQAVVMRHALAIKNHEIAAPNLTLLYPWEADVVSVTKSLLVHEYEVKISVSDFRADKKKKMKHGRLGRQYLDRSNKPREPESEYEKVLAQHGRFSYHPNLPNYFWYATCCAIDVGEIPVYAGWMTLEWGGKHSLVPYMEIRKDAPRLHLYKLKENHRLSMGRWAAIKLMDMYRVRFLPGVPGTM